MGLLVFVTEEINPFTPGGIGRVIHNVLKTMTEEDQRRTVILLLDAAVSATGFAAVFPHVRMLRVASHADAGRFEDQGHHPPQWAYTSTNWHWKSAVVFRALRDLARKQAIDYIEFPDYGGLAFVSTQQKRICDVLKDTWIAVRLHSTQAMLLAHEARAVTPELLHLVDLERKALRDCDTVVAQLPTVADVTRRTLGIPIEEWAPRLRVHAPPVLTDTRPPVARSCVPSATTPIVFGSKIQPFKRPDLFIRGVSTFLKRSADCSGTAVLAAHAFDPEYLDQISGMIGTRYTNRFVFDSGLSGAAREAVIAGSVFVASSTFESFCLSAFEASLLGAVVILNATNPAFGDNTPWQDGRNCIKFDGTALGLARALERAFALTEPLHVVQAPSDPVPWLALPPPWKKAAVRSDDDPLVSVIIPHYNLGSYLPDTLASVLEQTYSNIEIIVVDDCSTETESASLIETLRRNSTASFRVVQCDANLGLGDVRNVGISESNGAFIVPVDADDVIHPRFIEVAVSALTRHPEFDVFVPQAGYFDDGNVIPLPGTPRDFRDYAVFVGEALHAGTLANRFSTATALFRANLLQRYGYRGELRCYEDWDLYLRMAQQGVRFLASTDVYFYYRNRQGSMVKNADDPIRHRRFRHDLLRGSFDPKQVLPLSYLALLVADRQEAVEQPAASNDMVRVPAKEIRDRLARLEADLVMVRLVSAWQFKMLRPVHWVWRRLLPARRVIARLRGRRGAELPS